MKFKLLIFTISVLLSCSLSASKKERGHKLKNGLVIYSLPLLSTFLVNVDCDAVKKKERVAIKRISKSKDIKEFWKIFSDTSNFIFFSNATDEFDTRIHFSCIYKNQKKDICWAKTNMILINDKIYTYNKVVKSYLRKQKLIIEFL
jgi:hypothetical protein